MDVEAVRWISALALANLAAWSALLWMVKTLLNRAKHTEDKADANLKASERLINMHENANDFEFGTGSLVNEMREMNKDLRRSHREMIHYMAWFVEKTTGEKPEPYVEAGK